ncbi:MAG TPA: D-alanyl-D-alanine carboxypeptidase, partial [Terriglobales bacterium]|nr:D-alanyl-D-alanine carboxypeptidase [Terriglobales bacterium]
MRASDPAVALLARAMLGGLGGLSWSGARAAGAELGDVVRRLLKHSNNFVAEQILKTLGAERKGAPGTWPKGVEAVEDFLAEAGLPRGSYVMKNGSGL